MHAYCAEFRSKEKEVPGMPLFREFGGTEPPNGPSYRFTSHEIKMRGDKKALAWARDIAKSENLILLKVTKTVWKRRDAVC